MNAPQELIYGVTGQTLVYDAPEGRPSSVTSCTVYESEIGDDESSESATTGSPAVETNPNTTFDANSGPSSANPRKCNLTATTGAVVGRVYLATGTNSESEWVEVTEIGSGDHVLARNPLHNDYVSTNTFQSTRLTQDVDSTWIADEANISAATGRPGPRYRVRWVYVVSSATKVGWTSLDVVRYVARGDVTPIDVERVFPGFLSRVQTYDYDTQGRGTIAAAREWVDGELYQLEIRDEDIRDPRTYTRLVAFAANAEQHRQAFMAGGTGREQYEVSRAEFDEQVRKLVVSGKTPVDTGGDGAASTGVRKPLFVR